MEKLSESQKRKDSNEEARPKKSRKSIGDAVSYLQEKSKQEIATENAARHAADDPAATPESAKTTARTAEIAREASAATTSNHAVHSNPTATTVISNACFV